MTPKMDRDSKRNSEPRLSRIEGRLERAIESPFSRLFRSPVQPAEIERAAIKEIERTRKLGVNTIYVANVYSIVLSEKDADLLGDLIDTLESDLGTRILAYTSNNEYQMSTRPVVSFVTDPSFKLGEVYVIGETISPEHVAKEYGEHYLRDGANRSLVGDRKAPASATPPAARPVAPAKPSFEPEFAEFAERPLDPNMPSAFGNGKAAASPVGVPAAPGMPVAPAAPVGAPPVTGAPNAPAAPAAPAAPSTPAVSSFDSTKRSIDRAYITVGMQPPLVLNGESSYIIGRKGSADILLEDPQASRHHAKLVNEGDYWAIQDLNSTNGTYLNGSPVSYERLKDNDVITIASVDIVYRESRSF